MNPRLRVLVGFLLGLTVLGLPVVFPVAGEGVTVSSGTPSSFEVRAPASSRAGSSFGVTIVVRDAEGNPVTDYDQLDRTVELRATGSGELSKTTLSSGDFDNGRVRVSLTYNRAEEIRVQVREKDHVARGQSGPVLVKPGPPASFSVHAPGTIRAGQPFSVTLTVVDQYGNRVRNYQDLTNGLVVETSGVDKPSPQFIPAKRFHGGRLETQLIYNTAEEVRFLFRDEVNGIEARTSTTEVLPGQLDRFRVSAPEQARAGASFRLAVEAKDEFGNIVTDYAAKGRGVDLRVDGIGRLDPTFIPPGSFESGVAFAQVSYNEAETIQIHVQDRGMPVEGTSNVIEVAAAPPDQFEVKVPDQVRAGESFTVQVTAKDRFGNRVKQYDRRGGPVRVTVRGDGSAQASIDPAGFKDGMGSAEMLLKTTGTFRLEASSPEGDVTGQSGPVLVSPGEPGRIGVQAPENATAGENFSVILTVQDGFGNRIQQPGRFRGNIQVQLVNGKDPSPREITPAEFFHGKAHVAYRHDRAGTVAVQVEYTPYGIRTRSKPVQVHPADFDHFAVRSPGEVRAGQPLKIGLQMRDRFGNTLREVPSLPWPLTLNSTGSGDLEPARINRGDVTGPTFTVTARHYVAETMSVRVSGSNNRQFGVSPPIHVEPGPLSSFAMKIPESVSAPGSFLIRLEALDPYFNTIRTLNEREGQVELSATGQGKLQPGRVAYSEFVNGVAEVSARYRVAEQIRISARSGEVTSRSAPVTVMPGPPERFEVSTPQQIQAGRPFQTEIVTFDQFDNRVNRLPDDFHGVRLLSATGRKISPSKISRSMFEDGRARVYLAYPGTGSVSISARPLEDPLGHTVVDRFYLQRDVSEARIYLLGSASIPANLRRSGGSRRLQLLSQPASLGGEGRNVQFDDWFVKRIHQKQTSFDPLPSVELRLYPRRSVQVQTRSDGNLLSLRITAEEVSPPEPEETAPAGTEAETPTEAQEPPAEPEKPEVPSLSAIRSMIERKQFDRAESALSTYMEHNPEDEKAIQLRHRLERLREVLQP